MASLKTLVPFWRRPVSAGEAQPGPMPANPDDFGKASSYELLFTRLMDDPEARSDALFQTKGCRS